MRWKFKDGRCVAGATGWTHPDERRRRMADALEVQREIDALDEADKRLVYEGLLSDMWNDGTVCRKYPWHAWMLWLLSQDGRSPDGVLVFKPGKGPRKNQALARRLQMAETVNDHLIDGEKYTKAIAMTAAEFEVKKRTVERCWTELGKLVRSMFR